jgi:hypothetical protein
VVAEDDGFVPYAVVDTADGKIVEQFYTLLDAESWIIGEGFVPPMRKP